MNKMNDWLFRYTWFPLIFTLKPFILKLFLHLTVVETFNLYQKGLVKTAHTYGIDHVLLAEVVCGGTHQSLSVSDICVAARKSVIIIICTSI